MLTAKTNFRWAIVAMLFLSTTINYFDRVIIGILAPNLGAAFGWNEQEYGYIVFAFQLTYAIGTFFMGYVIDKLGTRWGMTLAVVLWGLASTCHSLARSWVGFAFARMGLGIGQAANYPVSIKIVAEWFPPKERAFATGLFNGGSNIGQVVAPLVIPIILMLFFSWQYVFIFSGILSFLWLILWLIVFRTPDKSRFVNQGELDYIREGSIYSEKVVIPWKKLVCYRQTWAVALGKMFADPVWYFYLLGSEISECQIWDQPGRIGNAFGNYLYDSLLRWTCRWSHVIMVVEDRKNCQFCAKNYLIDQCNPCLAGYDGPFPGFPFLVRGVDCPGCGCP